MSKVMCYASAVGGPIRRLPFPRLLASMCVVIGLTAMTVSPALAGQARLLAGVFGTASSSPANPYPLSTAFADAVDFETHDVYVLDPEGQRVEKFDSAGHFILMFGKEVDRTTGGNVCTAISGDACQAGVAGSSPGAFVFSPGSFYLAGVAVDNSGVPGQQGDVYVSDGSVISKFDSGGNIVSGWGNNGEGDTKNGPPNGQLNGLNATGPGPVTFGGVGGVEGIAVDRAGNLWVSAKGVSVKGEPSRHVVFEFGSSSSFMRSWSILFAGGGYIAVDSEENLYIGSPPDKLSTSGTLIGSVFDIGGLRANDLIVDPVSNELYVSVDTEGSSAIYRYASCEPHLVQGIEVACHQTESFGANNIEAEQSVAISIDPSTPADTLYATEPYVGKVLAFSLETVPDVSTGKAVGFGLGSAVLAGSVDPSGVELAAGLAGCRFEWGEHGAGEPGSYGHVAPCDMTAAQIGSGSSPVEVHANISGLQQGHVYHFRLVAGNHNQVNELIDEPSLGADLSFGPPSIESSSALNVGSNSAVVQAQVDPNNVDTHIRAEYGTEPGVYGQSTPVVDLGAGGSSQSASFQLLGLAPGTVYHYRFVAENALGEGGEAVVSPDRAFTTQTGGSFRLPDGRAWELVSPADKHGAKPFAISEEGLVQASTDGNAATYIVSAPTESEPAGAANGIQVLSRRTLAGWVSQDIVAPHEESTGASIGGGPEYSFFSTDLSRGLLQPFGSFAAALSPEASEQTPYLWTDFASGDVGSPCLSSCYRPLVTGAEGYANVPAETVFAQTCKTTSVCGPRFVGASPDLSHIVLTSEAPLVEGAPAGRGNSGESSLYEWAAGKLTLISVLPNEQPESANGLALGWHNSVARNAVSLDGSRVVWSDVAGRLFVRDLSKEKTVQVSSGEAKFQMADTTVSKVLFTEDGSLRECDIVESEGGLHCETSDLAPVGTGNSEVQGVVAGGSEDDGYVYFVANAVLRNSGAPVAGAQQGGCGGFGDTSVECNLYVRHDGTIKLVAVLSGDDSPDWGGGGGLADLTGLTARVSPDGRWFAFMSDRSLTGYDNRDSANGKPDEEVYLYDAVANGGAGRLICASCDPTGARPHGIEYESLAIVKLAIGRVGFASNQGIAANVPGWTPYGHGRALYQSRYLSDSGRLFFNSTDALVPQDSNGTGDVYEYEPSGVGDCTTESAMFVATQGGCLNLISSGASKEESGFVDASEDGSDVFFESGARLSPADTDSSVDVYDARVEGGFPEPPAPPACEGDACQSPIAAPEDQTPGSLTYHGPGNQGSSSSVSGVGKPKAKPLTRSQKLVRALKACKRIRSKGARNGCVRRARSRYGNARVGRATTKKRGR